MWWMLFTRCLMKMVIIFFINNTTIASVMFYKCCFYFQTLKPRQQLSCKLLQFFILNGPHSPGVNIKFYY